jgi:transposase
MARLCREVLAADPFSGTAYVFRSRSGKAIKILVYDGQGFWLCHKRLSQGRFRSWPTRGNGTGTVLQAHELQVLLYGGDPSMANAAPVWRPVSARA